MGFNDTMGPEKKHAGPLSFEELHAKGPPTREEIDALGDKYGMGMTLTAYEQQRVDEFYRTRRRAEHIPTILSVLYPTCEWSFRSPPGGNKYVKNDGTVGYSNDSDSFYENLEWEEDNPLPKPTKAELKKMEPFVQDILDQEAYIKLRRMSYPSEDSLIRALWEYVVEGNRENMDALQARRIAVKKRFPKPENKHWMVQSEDYMRIFPNTPHDVLKQIDEETAKRIAFGPGLEGDDVDPLATRKTLEEYAEEMMAKRRKGEKMRKAYGALPGGQMETNLTLADIEKESAKHQLPIAGDK